MLGWLISIQIFVQNWVIFKFYLFFQMQTKRGHRASSAIADKDQRILLPDKVAIISETRPSTTHTIYPVSIYLK